MSGIRAPALNFLTSIPWVGPVIARFASPGTSLQALEGRNSEVGRGGPPLNAAPIARAKTPAFLKPAPADEDSVGLSDYRKGEKELLAGALERMLEGAHERVKILVIAGPSGSGKSTAIREACGGLDSVLISDDRDLVESLELVPNGKVRVVDFTTMTELRDLRRSHRYDVETILFSPKPLNSRQQQEARESGCEPVAATFPGGGSRVRMYLRNPWLEFTLRDVHTKDDGEPRYLIKRDEAPVLMALKEASLRHGHPNSHGNSSFIRLEDLRSYRNAEKWFLALKNCAGVSDSTLISMVFLGELVKDVPGLGFSQSSPQMIVQRVRLLLIVYYSGRGGAYDNKAHYLALYEKIMDALSNNNECELFQLERPLEEYFPRSLPMSAMSMLDDPEFREGLIGNIFSRDVDPNWERLSEEQRRVLLFLRMPV